MTITCVADGLDRSQDNWGSFLWTALSRVFDCVAYTILKLQSMPFDGVIPSSTQDNSKYCKYKSFDNNYYY